ncbi:hypothetical protein M3Y97_00681400 [Aphelenchoides bicaudatus]|nr:hypothetical protein M3Y97_00681400 [Aphelenchoides bicaudatus]
MSFFGGRQPRPPRFGPPSLFPGFGGPPLRPSFFGRAPRGPPPNFHAPPYLGPPGNMGPPQGYRPPFFPPAFNPPLDEYSENFDEEDIELEEEEEQTPPPIRLNTRPQSFDVYMCSEDFWPSSKNDEAFSKALVQRNQQITPNDNEHAAVTSLVTRVKSALESIAATNSLPSVKVDEFREVGSYKKQTMLTRRITADLVVFLKTLPTPETVKQLGNGIVELLKTGATQPNEIFGVVPRDYGCDIAGTQAVLKILIAIPGEEFHKLNPGLHLKVENLEKNLAALRHALWFDEHAGQPAIKILVRLVKDIKMRCSGLAPLDIWTIELLSHYCVTCTPSKNSLPLTHAFRRFFQLLSSGFLLHTSIAVADPCDQLRRINHGFSLAEGDQICRNAQFISRLIMHNQYDKLLGLKVAQHKNIGTENETVVNLNIAPLKEAYNKALMVNEPPEDRFFSRAA